MNETAPPVDQTPPLRPGQLAHGWRTAFIAGWIGVIAGIGAVWQAARVAGIAPWWLGPETNSRSFLVIALPFLPAALAILVAWLNLRVTCYVGIAAGLATGAIALGDLDYPGLAAVEAAVGLAGVVISVACLGGRMRAVEDPDTAVAADSVASTDSVEPLDDPDQVAASALTLDQVTPQG